jgi:hypothetical protein
MLAYLDHKFLLCIFLLCGCGERIITGSESSRLRKSSDLYCKAISEQYATVSQSLNLANNFVNNKVYNELLRKKISPELEVSFKKSSYHNSENTEFVSLKFSYDRIPLCYSNLSMYKINNKITFAGSVPKFSSDKLSDLDFPSIREAKSIISKGVMPYKVKKYSKCLLLSEGKFVRALDLSVRLNNKPYRVIVSKKNILAVEKKFFDLAGVDDMLGDIKTSAYAKDPLDNYKEILETYEIPNQSIGGSLCGPKLLVEHPGNFDLAFSNSLSFLYSPSYDNGFFEQASVFTNAYLIIDWLESLEIEKWPLPQISISLYESYKSGEKDYGNNSMAEYDPSNNHINIGRGDGDRLKLLRRDPEPVQHEVNHGVIYLNINIISPDSDAVMLHEGLADALVFLFGQNPNLGEWICTGPSSLCMSDKYMRTADNTLKYDGAYFSMTNVHKKSQIVSGTIWDIAQALDFEKASKITYKAIRLLPSAATYKNLLSALVDADKALYKGENCSKLLDVFNNRGFSNLLTGVSC